MRKRITVTEGPRNPELRKQCWPWMNEHVFCYINVSCRSFANQQPHFSVTIDGRDFGGCCHDLALDLRPELKPVVDLHLSTDDGVPLHAAANAIHWVSGIFTDLPGFRWRPNSSKHDFGRQTPEWCTSVLRDHLRMDPQIVLTRVRAAVDPWLVAHSEYEVDAKHIEKLVHETVAVIVEEQRPRWKAEAEQALKLIAALPGDV